MEDTFMTKPNVFILHCIMLVMIQGRMLIHKTYDESLLLNFPELMFSPWSRQLSQEIGIGADAQITSSRIIWVVVNNARNMDTEIATMRPSISSCYEAPATQNSAQLCRAYPSVQRGYHHTFIEIMCRHTQTSPWIALLRNNSFRGVEITSSSWWEGGNAERTIRE